MASGYDHVSGLLEGVAQSLRPRARRELRKRLNPLDEQIIARTVNNPFTLQYLPWWQRRIEI